MRILEAGTSLPPNSGLPSARLAAMNLSEPVKFEPPFDRREFDRHTAPPFGRSPDGHWVVSVEDLPILPIPRQAVVNRDFIEFDGWVFPLSYVSKSFLIWLQASFIRWLKEDESARNREWIDGIVEAFEDALAGKL